MSSHRLKSLTLLRHAETRPDSASGRDFDRSLESRGETEAIAMGQEWRNQDFPIDKIIASPAARVVETLALFQPAAKLEAIQPQWDQRCYLASALILIRLVEELRGDAEHVFICGHNPGLSEVIMLLVPKDSPNKKDSNDNSMRSHVAQGIPTATIARIACDATALHSTRTGYQATSRLTYMRRPCDI